MKLTRSDLYDLAAEHSQLKAHVSENRRQANNLQKRIDIIEAQLSGTLGEESSAELTLGNVKHGYILRWRYKAGVPKYKEELAKRVSPSELLQIQTEVPQVRKLDVLRR